MRALRYGLRRQLILNLGLVMLLSSLLLSFFAMHMAQLRFSRDRTRYLRTVSEQVDQIVLLTILLESNGLPGQVLLVPSVKHDGALWPTDAALVYHSGKIRPLMGLPPSDLHMRVRMEMASTPEIVDKVSTLSPSVKVRGVDVPRRGEPRWLRRKLKERVVWERLRPLYQGKRRFATLWLRWDVNQLRREFYSYQGLLFLYLMIFCLLILLVVMLFLESRLVRPLNRLGEAITGLASDRLSTDLSKEVSRRDQIGELTQSFLSMREILARQANEREEHIRELQAANEALERAQEELVQREKLATVGALAAGVAHEVGNPLSAIMGYSELLQGSREFGDLELDLTERIHRETQRIDRIIRDLLDYARPVTHDKPGDPVAAVKEALELLRLQKRFRKMKVETVWPQSLPPVHLPENYLIQVLINILLNAADACEGSGRIAIRVFRVDRCALLEIADNGPGIPDELRDVLFEPFFTTKAPGKGVGLGLALCRRLVNEAGGKIEVGATEEGGAKFTIILPFASDAIPSKEDNHEPQTPHPIHPPKMVHRSSDEWQIIWKKSDSQSPEKQSEEADADSSDVLSSGNLPKE